MKELSRGQPVLLVANHSDGSCGHCLCGNDNRCGQGVRGRGYGEDGGLAEFVLVKDARQLVKLSTLDPVTAGPLADAGATSCHAIRKVLPRLTPGETAVVIGAGGPGAFAIQWLRMLSPATPPWMRGSPH